MITELPVNTIPNKAVKSSKKSMDPIPIPENMFKLPTCMAFIGIRGSGKTNATALLLYHYFQKKCFTRVFFITPSWESNTCLHDLPYREEDLYQNPFEARAALNDIIRKVENDARLHKNMKVYQKLFLKFLDHQKNGYNYLDENHEEREYMEEMQTLIANEYIQLTLRLSKDRHSWADDYMAEHVQFPGESRIYDYSQRTIGAEERTNQANRGYPIFFPPYKVQRPVPVLFIDDMANSDIYRAAGQNPLINLALRHRHVGGEGYGLSILYAVQTLRQAGLPRALRMNTMQCALFKTSDQLVIDGMQEEFAALAGKELFQELYQKAIGDEFPNHNFLCVDKNADERHKCFRRNYDQFLILPETNFEDMFEKPDNSNGYSREEIKEKEGDSGEELKEENQLHKRKKRRRTKNL